MKKLILITASVFSVLGITAQSFEWVAQMGSTAFEEGEATATDAQGNVFTVGSFQGAVDFDPGIPVATYLADGSDIFVSKLDKDGNFVWARQFTGIGNQFGTRIAVDAAGNVYFVGDFVNTVDFDNGIGTANLVAFGTDGYVCKLDSNGNFVWARSFEGVGTGKASTIALDSFGNVCIGGIYDGTVDLDPGVGTAGYTSNGSSDFFITKLDMNGNYSWSESFGGILADEIFSLSVDASNNIYATGYYSDTVDFDPGVGQFFLNASGIYGEIYMLKLDTGGNFTWARQFDCGLNQAIGYGIAVDVSGNVYTSGSFEGTIDVNPGVGVLNLTTQGETDAFISKLDASGNFIWAKQLGGTEYDGVRSLALDASGNVYVTGAFENTVDFDPGPGTLSLVSSGAGDIFILKLDGSGNLGWAKKMGGNSSDFPNHIHLDASGNVYTTGSFTATVDFDTDLSVLNLTAVGSYDIFVHKINQCVLNAGVTQNGIILSSDINSASYQWIDCVNNTQINGETNQSFTPTANGNYAVIVTLGNCIDTSACFTVSSMDVNEENGSPALRIFPNPTTSLVQIVTEEIVETVWIFNAISQLVQTENKPVFSMENLPAGIYRMQVKTVEGIRNTQVIKQ